MKIEQSPAQLKKNYLWNTLASFTNALSSALMLLACSRLLGITQAGIFSLAFALAQQFQVLGHFEIRSYQATDATEKFSFATYFGARIITCAIMIASIVAYTLWTKGVTQDALIIMLIAFLRVFDAFEDVFHGMFQQRGRLDIAGQAFFFRVVAMMGLFCIAALLTHSLLMSCICALAGSFVVCVLVNIIPAKRFVALQPSLNLKDIAHLLWACVPLFCGSFMLVYITNAPKYAIDTYLSQDMQAIYSYIFMPSLVINLLSGFVFKPLLTEMSSAYLERAYTRFFGIITKGFGSVCIATIVTMVLAYTLGVWVLSSLYAIDLSPYKLELMVLLVGGLFNALGIILYYAVVTMRHQHAIYMVYGVSCVVCYGAYPWVSALGLLGAALIYDVAMLICALGFLATVIFFFMRDKKSQATV